MLRYHQGHKDTMYDFAQREQPWSHDVWSFGIVLLQIITGCQIDQAYDQVVVAKN